MKTHFLFVPLFSLHQPSTLTDLLLYKQAERKRYMCIDTDCYLHFWESVSDRGPKERATRPSPPNGKIISHTIQSVYTKN